MKTTSCLVLALAFTTFRPTQAVAQKVANWDGLAKTDSARS